MAFDKKKYAQQKQFEIEEITNNAVRKVLDFKQDPQKVVELLDFLAKAPNYSFKNQMMIRSQYEGALFAMGAKTFEDILNVKVLQGSKPIQIIAPVFANFIKRNDKYIKLKYASKEEKEKVENKQIKVYRRKDYFQLVNVYDITQTNAKPEDYPEYYPNRRMAYFQRDPEIVKDVIEATKKLLDRENIKLVADSQKKEMGASVGKASRVSYGTDVGGSTIITYRAGLNDGELLQVLLHETTHALLHLRNNQNVKEQHIPTLEFEAEMSSYVVSKRYGLDTSENSIPYIASWTQNMTNIKDMEESIERVTKCTNYIINQIDKELDPEKMKDFFKNNPDLELEKEEAFGSKEIEKVEINNENKHMFYKIDKKEIDEVAKMDIVKVAMLNGKELKFIGDNRFVDVENNRMKFNHSKNTYYNGETKKAGNVINFLRNEMGMSFVESVEYLQALKDSDKYKNIETQQMPVSKKEVENAINKSIFDVASDFGYSFKSSGKYYIGIEHDSLVLNKAKNSYNWYSKGEYGNTINFVQKELGVDFINAVKYLNDKEFTTAKDYVEESSIKYDASLYEYEPKEQMNEVRNYLVNKRKIDSDLVEHLIENDYIKQDKNKNVVFQWKNNEGEIVGSDKRGTGYKLYKGIDFASDPKYPFNFSTIDKPNDLYIFEAPIDALSYRTLHPNSDGVYMSMSGLKDKALLHQYSNFTQKYGQEPNKIYLCVDNDDAGKNFVSKFTEHELISKESGEKINFIPKFPEGENCKDWNDELIEKKYMNKSEEKEVKKEKKIKANKNKEIAGIEI
ncbi:DUF3991 domain-containing protein [Staphylococcus pseudintermedius]|nr:DUF3991 domain-containing protein [Staphylococcus pseudintermedius]EGQ3588738.1 DUF3991 domain-containing protein [Staphylococcus pseudintermedius]EGQ3801327.1 DUF3991 domain-containing protein [Staphylococcus pseudintermedius]EIA5730935.1 toprim domain-containing protein [Staphylococcus pseudintermedius]EJG5600582.1 toprim domain-containing protein [Staphylococcus pseudintermedius]